MTQVSKRVLMLTNCETGLSNIFLATVHELVQLEPQIEVHLASFKKLALAATSAFDYAIKCSPKARRPVFHQFEGPDGQTAILEREPRFWEHLENRIGISNARMLPHLCGRMMLPWDAAQFAALCKQVLVVAEEVMPDITIIDPLFTPGMTVCRHLGLKFALFSPNMLKDVALPAQPKGQALWKYPVFATGHPFPVPWYLIPSNILYGLCFGFFLTLNPLFTRLEKEMEECSGMKVTSQRNLVTDFPAGLKILVGCREEIDFPLVTVPDWVVPCGPIIRPAPPLAESDPALAEWLARGPTVYINMGTLKRYTEADATELAVALQVLLDEAAGSSDKRMARLQVLWKLKKKGVYSSDQDSRMCSNLSAEINEDRVRIVNWLNPEPSAVLESPSVVCAVHHGGANTWFEALCAGVPQVILPVWLDTYEAPHRAAWLGVGRGGNPMSAPKIDSYELAPVLVEVILGKGAAQMRAKAQELAVICARGGLGRENAAREILAMMSTEDRTK